MGAQARPSPAPAVSVGDVIDQLKAVRPNGHGRWMARCPAHGDRSASLSVREGDDGRTLLHCFSGCTFAEVVAALHLEPGQLFPPSDRPWRPTAPRRDPKQEARASLADLRGRYQPVPVERLEEELELVGALFLGGPAAFAQLPGGFKPAHLRTLPLRFIFEAMAALVKEGTPRRWFSPLAVSQVLDRTFAAWGLPESKPNAFRWAWLAVRESTR